MTLALTLALSIYLVILGVLIIGSFLRSDRPAGTRIRRKISVIIPARNESANLPTLVDSLRRQQHPNFEVMIVDDRSDDDLSLKTSTLGLANLKVIPNNGSGKKHAITTGVLATTGDIIVTTDADCTFHPAWLDNIDDLLVDNARMLIGPVRFDNSNTFFRRIQQVELASVMGTGISLLNLGQPVMANGANLAYLRSGFKEVNGYDGNLHVPSGDDEFLMRKFIVRFGQRSVIAASGPESLVTTLPPSNLMQFISQRSRWASKWRHNDSSLAKVLAVCILIFQTAWLAALAFAIIIPALPILFLMLAKIVLEGFFLYGYCRRLQMAFDLTAFFFLQIIYPLYVLYIGIGAYFSGYQWKGRDYRR
jgi:poly-beta-1,6-N-acetyl-D-glucosamine synthase